MKSIVIWIVLISGVGLLGAQQVHQTSMDSFYVMIEGEKIELGDPFKKIITLLGETKFTIKKTSNKSLRQYDYDAISVFLSDSNAAEDIGERIIFGMTIYSEEYSVVGGLRIGASLSDITAELGEPEYQFENSYYYENYEYDVLEIKFTYNTDDIVTEIQLFMGT